MSDFAFYLKRSQEASSLVTQLKRAVAEHPTLYALRVNLAAAEKMAEQTHLQFVEAAKLHGRDVFRYRIVQTITDEYLIKPVSKSLELFQDVFSQVHDALVNGPKLRARLSPATVSQTALEFGYSFSGSLGIVITVPSSRDLFEDRFENTVSAVFDILKTKNDDEVRDAAVSLGRAALQKLYQWAELNYSAGFDLDLQWVGADGFPRGSYIGSQEFGTLADVIGKTSETQKETALIPGVLVGFNSLTRSFHFVQPEGETYRGSLGGEFPAGSEWTVNHRYLASIETEQTVRYATGEETLRHTLLRLKPMDKTPSVER